MLTSVENPINIIRLVTTVAYYKKLTIMCLIFLILFLFFSDMCIYPQKGLINEQISL